MFERFTGSSRQVVVRAQEEARALGHGYIGTEHLLVGVLEADGIGGDVLRELGLETGAVREAILRVVGKGDRTAAAGQIAFAPRAKKVLELALREAISLGCSYIGTEHIVLGLVREDAGAAMRILLDFDADAQRVRDAVMNKLPYPAVTGRRRRLVTGPVSQWEYRVERRDTLDAAWLNELGADGWEFVAIDGGACVFKRRCPPRSLRAAG